MASRTYLRGILRAPSFHTSGSAPVIADSPSSSVKEPFVGSLPYQACAHMPWRNSKPYIESNRNSSRQRRTEKPIRPPLPVSVFRAASAENNQYMYSWSTSNCNSIRGRIETEEPVSSEISLCSSFGNVLDHGASPAQDQSTVEFTMHHGQPHAYALYDFDTKVEGDLQFRAGDLIMLEDIVDEAWYRGHSVRTGQVGIFPMNHVEVKIPLVSGLYTNSQPTPTIRTSSDVRDRMKQSPLHKTTFPIRNQQNSSKDDAPVKRTTGPFNKPVLRRSQTQFVPHSSMYAANTTSPAPEPEAHATSEKSESNHIPLSSVPSIITSRRPRSQTSVYQLAQNLEQQGVTINRTKTIPPGGRAIFPSSISPRCGVSPPTVEQPNSVPDEPVSEGMGKRLIAPSAYMVPTPLAMIARERNRILGKDKLAPTEDFPTATSSDPALTNSTKMKDQQSMKLPKTSAQNIVYTKSEINLTRKPSAHAEQTNFQFKQVRRPNQVDMFETDPTQNDNDSGVYRATLYNKRNIDSVMDATQSKSKPLVHQKPVYTNSSSDIPWTLKCREDTLVRAEKYDQEEHNSVTPELHTSKPGLNLWENTKLSPDQNAAVSNSYMNNNQWLKTTATLDLQRTNPADDSTIVPEVSHSSSTHQSIDHSSSVNHAIPQIPDSSNCLKVPNSIPNLDKKQTDGFKDAIYSSLKNKHKRPDQWLYVCYDYVGTESGDLTVQAGSVLRCLDPLPSPAHIHDLIVPDCWLRCSTWYGQVGQVPSTFVRRILDPEELNGLLQYRPRAQALYDFTPEAKDDLALTAGDILYLFDNVDANWFRGESASTGQQGIFPVPFVRVICPL